MPRRWTWATGCNTAIVTLEAAETKVWQVDLGRAHPPASTGQTSHVGGPAAPLVLAAWPTGRPPRRWCSSASKAAETGLRRRTRPGAPVPPGRTATTGPVRSPRPDGTFLLGAGPRPADAGQVRLGPPRVPPVRPARRPGRPAGDVREHRQPGARRRDALRRRRAGAGLGSARRERITRERLRRRGARAAPGGTCWTRGDDVVSICPDLSSVIAGGAGNDLLLGSNRTDDFLLGGPGLDRATGHARERHLPRRVTRSCER